jgi:hypothetical protein
VHSPAATRSAPAPFAAASLRAAATLAIALALALTTAACGSDSATGPACKAEPTGSILAFFQTPGEGGSRSVRATVLETRNLDGGVLQVMLRDSSGVADSLRFRAPDISLPLEPGETYDIQVDFYGGFPSASGVLVRDARGLLFAAATDQAIGGHVLKNGVTGFSLEIVDSGCRPRQRGQCWRSITNTILRVVHEGETRDLFHGDSATLGSFRVTCLTAQDVVYTDECADAGLVGISYAIARVE